MRASGGHDGATYEERRRGHVIRQFTGSQFAPRGRRRRASIVRSHRALVPRRRTVPAAAGLSLLISAAALERATQPNLDQK
jgi:hypothetical protein